MRLLALLENAGRRKLLALQQALIDNPYDLDVETDLRDDVLHVEVPGIVDLRFGVHDEGYLWDRTYQAWIDEPVSGMEPMFDDTPEEVAKGLSYFCVIKLFHLLQRAGIPRNDMVIDRERHTTKVIGSMRVFCDNDPDIYIFVQKVAGKPVFSVHVANEPDQTFADVEPATKYIKKFHEASNPA